MFRVGGCRGHEMPGLAGVIASVVAVVTMPRRRGYAATAGSVRSARKVSDATGGGSRVSATRQPTA